MKFLKNIGEVTKELGVTDYMLREWEKKGYLDTVEQFDGKRVYSDEQISRIIFIRDEIEKQRKQGIKRTDYRKIEDELTDKFGGEVVVREGTSPQAIGEAIRQELYMRDQENKNMLQQIYQSIQQLPEPEASGVPADKFAELVDVHQKLANDFIELKKEKKKIEEELREREREVLELRAELNKKKKFLGLF